MKSKVLACLVLFTLVFTTKLFANEKDVYEFSWLDPDKEVFVLQNRKYRKVDHAYINIGGGITTSGAFVDSTSIQGRVGYFFSEDWGLEGIYAKNSGKENTTAKSIRGQGTGGTGSAPFRRIVDGYTGAMIVWSPFYSKINTFNKIVYMDWIFGVGYAQLKEKNNKNEFGTDINLKYVATSESHSGIIWEFGLKFYINESFSIRTDLTAVNYKAENVQVPGTSLKQNYDATVSLGYTF
jgi:outer membrane beta-barrel protein